MGLTSKNEGACSAKAQAMGSWAHGAADRLNAETLQEKQESEAFFEQQRRRRECGPQLWQKLRDWLQAGCSDFNKDMGKRVLVWDKTPPNEASVRYLAEGRQVSNRRLHLVFENDRSILTFRIDGGADGVYRIALDERGTAYLEGNGQRVEVETVGSGLLDMLLQRVL